MRLVVSHGIVVIDEWQRMPGRGAYLHPTPECGERARQRRAVGRALRQPDANLDAIGLESWPPTQPSKERESSHERTMSTAK